MNHVENVGGGEAEGACDAFGVPHDYVRKKKRGFVPKAA